MIISKMNSLFLKSVFPKVDIGTFKIKTRKSTGNDPFGGNKFSFEYRNIFETYLRVKRKTDNKWFLIRFISSLENFTDNIETRTEWIKHCFDEAYVHLILYIIPEDKEIEATTMYPDSIIEDECQISEEERLIHRI